MTPGVGRDGCPSAAEALRAAVADQDGRLGALLGEPVDHLEALLADGPDGTVGVVAVPVAVFGLLSPAAPPSGLLAAAGATYLAFAALDDQLDGDPPAFWADRSPTEVVLGAQHLLLTAQAVAGAGSDPAVAGTLSGLHHELVARAIEGQLRTAEPLTATTSPADVMAAVDGRSGAVLGGFAAMAAVAAGATEAEVEAARTFGHELGVARQHLNDVSELVGERTTDLRNGTATMATALALQVLSTTGREALLGRLHAAADDPGVRQRLVHDDLAAAIGEVCVLIQLHLGRARSAVSLLRRDGVVHDGALRLVESTAATVRSTRVRSRSPVQLRRDP